MQVHPEHLKNRVRLAIRIADEATRWNIRNENLYGFPLDGLIWTRICEAAGINRRPSTDTISAAIAILASRQVAR